MKRIFSSGNLLSSGGVDSVRAYDLAHGRELHIVEGSVLDYASKKGAIVNSANPECLGGGGVDFALSKKGGPRLLEDRKALPSNKGIRCPMGEARLTGPNTYGKLGVPYVIHACGPNYNEYKEEAGVEEANRLLRSAYQCALDCTGQWSKNKPIKKIAFSLLSAGRYKGDQSLEHVLGIGIQAIKDWCDAKMEPKVDIIILYAFNTIESKTLVQLCDSIIGGGRVPHD